MSRAGGSVVRGYAGLPIAAFADRGPRPSFLEGIREARRLRGRAPFEAPESEPYLPAHGARARRRAKSRLPTKSFRGIHEVVDVPSNGRNIHLRNVSRLDSLALGDDVRNRRQEPIDIVSGGLDLRLVAVASGECACAAEHDCECAASHGRESLAFKPVAQHERRGAVQEAAACYIRRSPALTAGVTVRSEFS